MVPYPVNTFSGDSHPDGSITVERTQIKPGDVLFRAEHDVFFVVTACSSDTRDVNGGKSTPLSLEVLDS